MLPGSPWALSVVGHPQGPVSHAMALLLGHTLEKQAWSDPCGFLSETHPLPALCSLTSQHTFQNLSFLIVRWALTRAPACAFDHEAGIRKAQGWQGGWRSPGVRDPVLMPPLNCQLLTTSFVLPEALLSPCWSRQMTELLSVSVSLWFFVLLLRVYLP